MGIVVMISQPEPVAPVSPVMPSGLYLSDKGSTLIKFDGSSNGKTEQDVNRDYCLIIDVDSGCSFLKKTADLKGSYTKVADIDDLVVTLASNLPCDCNCDDDNGGW